MNHSWLSLRLLAGSLIGTIFIASVGLGLLFNQLFEQLSDNSQSNIYQREKTILHSLEQSYLLYDNSASFLAAWQNQQYTLVVMSLAEFPLPEVLEEQLLAGEVLVLESEEGVSLHKHISGGQEILTLHLSASASDPNESLRFWLTSLFYLCLLALVLVWLYPLMLRLLMLRRAAQEFGAGHFDARVKVGSISYIADIEREFNRMAQRIENLVSDIKLLSSAVSHDLRTPLARIRFGVETIAEEDDKDSRDYFQQRIINDVDVMVELVENMLDFARLERQLLRAESETLDLNSLLPELIAQADCQSVEIVFSGENKPVNVNVSRHFITMLFNNILGNAIKFAASNIVISVTTKAQAIELEVEDDGPGIPEPLRDEILQPFVRAAEAKTQNGYGLGLAVVKRIVDFYDGNITFARSSTLGGASVLVALSVN